MTTDRPLALIVALGSDLAIGRNGDLLWSLPGDLPRFKRLTTGHPVIMGRKTWQSLRRRPLPGRLNIVISRSEDFHPEGAIKADSVEAALQAAAQSPETPFVIGGGQIYKETLPLATHLYLTEVDQPRPDADTWFPLYNPSQWRITAQSEEITTPDGIKFRFTDLEKI